MVKIHFLNVGHGDCTVIEHASGRLTVIDINNGDELDDNSQAEVIAELEQKRRSEMLAAALRGRPALPPIGGLAAMALNRPTGFGAGLRTPTPARLGALAGLGLAPAASGLGFGGALSGLRIPPPRSKKNQLKEAGYETELTNPIAFLKALQKPVFRYIQTHPDLDHMRGLSSLRSEGIQVTNFWDTEHKKIPDFKSNSDRQEWAEYNRLRNGNGGVTVLRLFRGHNGVFWNEEPEGIAGGDGIEILAPTPELIQQANKSGNPNNLSHVLRINAYGVSVILGGDAEADVWEDIVKHYGTGLKCNVLKASHHGRDTGYHQKAVEFMRPGYTIVSVGKKPDTDASNKYRSNGGKVWSTRWYGNLTLQITREQGTQWFAEHVK